MTIVVGNIYVIVNIIALLIRQKQDKLKLYICLTLRLITYIRLEKMIYIYI